MLAIYFLHYNFLRVHGTLKQTPAMSAGLADRQWAIEDMIGLLDKAVQLGA